MKKYAASTVLSILGLCLGLLLGGCADLELLEEQVRTAAIEQETVELTQEEVVPSGEAEDAAQQSTQIYRYTYENLDEAEKLWYDDIFDCLDKLGEDVSLNKEGIDNGLDETYIDRIFQCVLMDHPELFYVEGYTYTKYNRGEKIVGIHFSGTYGMEEEQVKIRREEIQNAAEEILRAAPADGTDYDKIKYVYETIIRNTEYDLNSPDNQNIYSVFVNHRSVCQGYAKSVQYLLQQMGVECALVQGTVDTGEGHAWNLVKADGDYYYVDATWGDASYQAEDELSEGYVPEISYDYLCVTTKQLLRTHIIDSYVPLPVCVATKDNYYVREGALFDSYDREKMQVLFDRTFAEGKQEVTLKCTDNACFHEILSAMIENQDVFDYLDDSSKSVVYTHNEKQLSMTFWVTNE